MFLYHFVSEPCTGSRYSLSSSNTNQTGMEIVRPEFLPVTLILISRYRESRSFRASFRAGMYTSTESRSSPIGHINLDRKQAGKPSAQNGHARFEAAGTENQLTIRLVRHSQRKRGATDRLDLRSLASVLDPTDRGDCGNVGIIRSPVRAIALPDNRRGGADERAVR